MEFITILKLTLTFNDILLSVRVVGIFLNIIALRVLVAKEMKSSASTYLIMLAFFDMLFLLTYGISNVLVIFDICLIKPNYWVTEVILIAAISVGACGSIFTTVAVTMERYIAIAHPIKIKILCSTKAKIFILLTEICITVVITGVEIYQAIGYYIPLVPTTGLHEALKNHTITNTTSVIYLEVFMTCVYYRTDPTFQASGFPLIQYIILYIFPTCINFVLNVLIVRVLSTTRPITATRHPDNDLAKRRLLKSVMAVSITSIIAYPVSFTCACINMYAPDQYIPYDVMFFIEDLVHTINSSINCVFYCLIGKRFRSVLLNICRCRNQQNQRAPAPDIRLRNQRFDGFSTPVGAYPE